MKHTEKHLNWRNKTMWLEIGIVGTSIGIGLGLLKDYYDKREYRKTFKRNLRELQNEKTIAS